MAERREDPRIEAAYWLAAQVRWEDRLDELEGCFRPAAPSQAVAAAA
jgi:hypothetical protein